MLDANRCPGGRTVCWVITCLAESQFDQPDGFPRCDCKGIVEACTNPLHASAIVLSFELAAERCEDLTPFVYESCSRGDLSCGSCSEESSHRQGEMGFPDHRRRS